LERIARRDIIWKLKSVSGEDYKETFSFGRKELGRERN
jgi:hypothetical protein